MRYFLLFFLCFFLNFASYAANEDDKLHSSFMMTLQEKADLIQKTLNESMKVERGLLTGEKGLTPFYETEFARFRLASCSGGIPENNRVFLMVESQIKDGWRLQKPVIPAVRKSGSIIVDEKIAYPLNPKAVKKTSFYEGSAFFALLYELNSQANMFEIKKEISFTACKEDVCKTEVVPLELFLDRSNTYQTDVCALMLREFQNVPTEPNAGELSAVLHQIDKNYLVLKTKFERDISYINLQIEEEFDWVVSKIEYKDNQAQVLIYSPKEIDFDSLNVKLLTSLGAFDLKLQVQEGVFVPFKPEFSYLSVLTAGMGLFFFSPIFVVFLMLNGTKKALKQQVKQIKYILFAGAFLFVVGVYFFDGFKNLFEVPKWMWLVSLGAVCYLLFKPVVKMRWFVLFFLLWPKPYLLETLYGVEEKSLSIFVVFGIWVFLCYLPFKIFQNVPKFFKEIKKVKQYPYLIRIPQVVMLMWLVTVGIGQFVFENKSISDLSNLQSENKTIFVSVENGYCLSCLMNKMKLSYIQKTTNLILKDNLEILTVDTSSKEGRAFLKKNHLLSSSYGLLYGERLPYPLFIWGGVDLEEWQKHLSEVTDTSDVNKHFISGKDGEH